MADNATKIVDANDAVVFVEFLILNEIIKIKTSNGKVDKDI